MHTIQDSFQQHWSLSYLWGLAFHSHAENISLIKRGGLGPSNQFNPATFYSNVCTIPIQESEWSCVYVLGVTSYLYFYDFSIWFWKGVYEWTTPPPSSMDFQYFPLERLLVYIVLPINFAHPPQLKKNLDMFLQSDITKVLIYLQVPRNWNCKW